MPVPEKKMALFVEGYVELCFFERLVKEIAPQNITTIESREIRGGSTCRRISRRIRNNTSGEQQQFFFLIYNCAGDHSVKTRMLEEYENLKRENYSAVVCVRDVHPIGRTEIERLRRELTFRVPTKPIEVRFVLSIMEIEAYFLAEHTHFAKIDPQITIDSIKQMLGFNPVEDDMMQRDRPADDLKACYQVASQKYDKKNCQHTINALNLTEIYLEFPKKFPELQGFVQLLDEFLSR
jgi:hypothetical protein